MEEIDKKISDFLDKSYKNNVNKVRRILNHNKEEAEDIVQQTIVSMLQYKDTYNPEKGALQTWFNKILYRELKNHQDKMKNIVSLDEEILNELINPTVTNTLNEEISNVTNDRHRKILKLFYTQGYSVNEVAKVMSCSQSNVTTVCNRFKQNLRMKYGV